MLPKLMKALYPVTSLARLCGLLPIQIHGACSVNATHNTNINRIKTFDNTNDDVTNKNDGVVSQHQSIFWHILGPIWLILIIGTYLTQLFYYKTLNSNSTTFELFHEHASVLYIIFCLIIIQFKRSAILESHHVMAAIERKLIEELKCNEHETMYYQLLHKYSLIGLAIFIAIMIYEMIIRSYERFSLGESNSSTNSMDTTAVLADTAAANLNETGPPQTPETEFLTKLIVVFLNVVTTSIGLALQINFFMFMMVLRLRFKTVNYEINKIAKITEHDDDDDDDDNDTDNTDDDDDDTDNTDNTDKENANINAVITTSRVQDELNGHQSPPTRNKINNLRMLATVRHGIYTGSETGFEDNTFYASNIKWSSPDEYDESNKFYLRIRTLADIHDKLSLNLSIINSIYSVQLLFAIGIQFVLITATLYEEYETIDDHVSDFTAFFINLIFNLIRCAQTLMLIWICSNTCYHANRASIFIHKIVYMEESKLKREIENFSMQLLHNKVQVTAGGFFPIDFTLLYTIVGAVTTYLVILVQFHLADKEIQKKRQGGTGPGTAVVGTSN